MKLYKQNERGAAIMIAVIFFVVISLIVVVGMGSSVTRDYVTYRDLEASKQAFLLAESGLEDALYRVKHNLATSSPEVMVLNGGTITTTITPLSDVEQLVSTTATFGATTRTVSAKLTKATIATFAYGGEIGPGGLTMANSSRINGSVYSSGPISGSSNIITGSVTSAWTEWDNASGGYVVNGSISNIVNQGGNMMYAKTISGSTISGTPYCSSISGSQMHTPLVAATCTGMYQLNTSSTWVKPLPLSDAQITEFENEATTGGNVTCSGGKYQVTSNQSLGPKVIPCDLHVLGNKILTLTGPVWVKGDIELKSTAHVNVSTFLGSTTVPLIADKDTDRNDGGTVKIANNAQFNADPGQNTDAQVLVVSWNTDPSGKDAITVENNIGGKLMVYAAYGKVLMQNDANLSQITAYKLDMSGNSVVNYPTSLKNMNINSGTSSVMWSIYNWKETK